MAKIIQNVALDIDTFQWLREEQVGRRHKTLSMTLCEILKNYQIMIRSVEKAQIHAERTEKARLEAEQLAKSYRAAVVVDNGKV
jgi:hypothetical protein